MLGVRCADQLWTCYCRWHSALPNKFYDHADIQIILGPIRTGLFFCFLCPGRGGIQPDTLAANNFKTAYNRDSVFAQIDAELIF